MTIHNPQNEKITQSIPSPTQPNRPRHFRTMSSRNPFDYFRLLVWVLFKPDMIKMYRIRCDVPQRFAFRQQALWLITHLLWGSLALSIAVPLGLAALPLDIWLAAFVLVAVIGAWILTGRYGLRNDTRIVNQLILGNLLVAFGVVSLIAISMNQSTVSTLPVIIMSVIAIVASLIGIAISSAFQMKTIEKIAGFITIVIAGGLSTLVFDLMEAAWIPVSVIIIAIFLVGVVEDRYAVSKHSQ
ncbi:MAG: hypothetical protein DWQ04_19460 [Chloroflexi bacterium]|nr:MAG: hypothetical protein DWQ04_19460 [Chloroflexota bacterium]